MKILITGANGLLGHKLSDAFGGNASLEVLATGRRMYRLLDLSPHISYQCLDITNQQDVTATVERFSPDVIIHTAAMTNVDECEQYRQDCRKVNVTAVRYLVEAARKCCTHFIHLSTDFIFNGHAGPLNEQAVAAPINYYGETKLHSEYIVKAGSSSWAIVRTVLVYGVTSQMSRSNIILWVKNSLENNQSIKVVNDQWRTPTFAEDLATGCVLIATGKHQGIFNICGKNFLTPYEMAIETARHFGLNSTLIEETNASKFQQSAKRPAKTGLIIDKAINELGYRPRSFRQGITTMAAQLRNDF